MIDAPLRLLRAALRVRLLASVAVALCAAVGRPAFAAAGDPPCTPRWDEAASCPPGVDLSVTVFGGATVGAFARWDDGNGPALFVGGSFDAARCDGTIAGLMRCVGDEWSSVVGKGGASLSSSGAIIVSAMTVFDDGLGGGPALYVGGIFETADGAVVNNIARWDGRSWSALAGPNGIGVDGAVRALAVFDDGSGPSLHVGGLFQHAGGQFVGHIARWDGKSWSPLTTSAGGGGVGTSAAVNVLAVHDDGSGPALFVGGQFQSAGGLEVRRIAKWDGAAWHPLLGPNGVGTNGSVSALCAHDDGSGSGPVLYVGGSFVWVGGTDAAPVTGLAVNHIGRWDGAEWTALEGPAGKGTSGSVADIVVLDDGSGAGPVLHVGGNFASAGGVFAGSVARWDGAAWSALVPSDGSAIGLGGAVPSVSALFVDDGAARPGSPGPSLLAGGSFTTAGGRVVNRIARWDGATWSALEPGDSSFDDIVMTLATIDDGGAGETLYAGGWFTTAGGVLANRIARREGSGWGALGGPSGVGVGSVVLAIEAFAGSDPAPSIFAAGSFTTAGGVSASRIARWDGAAWSSLPGVSGNGVNGTARALRVFDEGKGPALYVGGSFSSAAGTPASNIARWDGTAWSAVASGGSLGLSGTVEALIEHDFGEGPRLVAGGGFGGRCAAWDGSSWTALAGPGGQGLSSTVNALALFDDGSGRALYAGGVFTTADGQTVNRIARWNGSAWSPLAGPSAIGVNGTVRALAVFDDGEGPALYAAGSFTSAGGVPVDRIARWDGRGWEALPGPGGVGVDGTVRALAVHDDGSGPALYAGGDFVTAGGTISLRFARWVGCAGDRPILGDLDGDGTVGPADLAILLGAWGTRGPGDLDADGTVGAADLAILLGAWGS